MSTAAFTIGSTVIYRSALMIAIGAAVFFCLSQAIYTAHGGLRSAMWLFFPPALILSVLLSRFLHWYCHAEQYDGFWKAMTDYSTGSFVIIGVFAGIILAAFLMKKIGYVSNLGRFFDCIAPGTALLTAFIRLSALFDSTCVGKVVVSKAPLQTLPIAAELVNSAGGAEYRFATFFVEFLLLLVVFIMTAVFFRKYRREPLKEGCRRDGNVAVMFIVWYSAVELIMDSTRYDSSFVHFNGFVSIVQMACALTIMAVLICFSIRSVKVNGRRGFHWGVWLEYFFTLAAVGVSEYMVQRHGDKYMICYTIMAIACYYMADSIYRMYLSLRDTTAEDAVR